MRQVFDTIRDGQRGGKVEQGCARECLVHFLDVPAPPLCLFV